MKKSMLFIATVVLSTCLNFPAFAGQWLQNDTGWWWQNDDGSYPVSCWKQIEEKWYYFNENGYMLANQWLGNYYLGEDGAMLTDTITPDGYYVDGNGIWIQDAEVLYDDNAYKDNLEKPKVSTFMSQDTDSSCSSIIVRFENKGDSDIIIYGQGSQFRDLEYSSFNRDTYLTTKSQNAFIKVKTITVKPKEHVYLVFEVIGDSTWYDKNSQMNFFIEYKGNGFSCSVSPYYGADIMSMDSISKQAGVDFTLDQVKLLPY